MSWRVAIVAALLLRQSAFPIVAAPVNALAFSPDGSALASSGQQRVDLRSPFDLRVQDIVPAPFPRITSIVFQADGALIIGGGVSGSMGKALVFSANKKTGRNFGRLDDLVTCVAASADGNLLALGSADRNGVIYSLAAGTETNAVRLVGHSGQILAAAFAPTSELLLTASVDRSIKSWTTKGELVRSLNHHTEAVHALAFRGNASGPLVCASGSDDETVRIWQPVIGRMVRIIRGVGAIYAIAYAKDGSALFCAGKRGVLYRIDSESDQILAEVPAHNDVIYSLALSPDGKKIATGDWKGEVKLWNLDERGALMPIHKD